MIRIASIVEGDGEVQALPVLLRRFSEWKPSHDSVATLPPIRVRRDRFLNKEEEFRKQLLLAAAKCGDDGWILVVLDADDDCPAELGQRIYEKAQQYVPHRRLSVVVANREFEAWFIAAAHSINGLRGFSVSDNEKLVPEVPRNAKNWMQHIWLAARIARFWTNPPLLLVLICSKHSITAAHSENYARSGACMCKNAIDHSSIAT